MAAKVIDDVLKCRYGSHLNEGAKRNHKTFAKKVESFTSDQDFLRRLNGPTVSNLDRVNSVLEVLPYDNFKFNDKMAGMYQKSSSIAKTLREVGNTFYKNRNFGQALEVYSKSLMFAPPKCPKGDLSLAYANRSAVFYETKDFGSCIGDIKRAIKAGHPSKDKLLDRAKKCQGQLKVESERVGQEVLELDDLYLYLDLDFDLCLREQQSSNSVELRRRKTFCDQTLFRLVHPNPVVPNAEEFIEIKSSPERGRHVVTTKALMPGTVLIVDEPYSKVLLDELKWCVNRCHQCHGYVISGVSCPSCVFAFYCSEYCLNAAAQSHHKFECRCLAYFHQLSLVRIFLLALRTVTTLGPAGILNLYRGSILSMTPETGILGSIDGIYQSPSYTAIHHLISHPDKCEDRELLSYTITSLSLVQILDKHSAFFDLVGNDHEKTKLKSFTASLLLLHILNLPCNAHSLQALSSDSQEKIFDPDWIRTATAEEYGAGAFGLLSLINHSCDPNILRVNNCRGQVAVIAIKSLLPGDELLDNYGHHYALEDTLTRRRALLNNYYFDCSCVACAEDWPQLQQLRTFLPRFICPKCSGMSTKSPCQEFTRNPGVPLLQESGTTMTCDHCHEKYASEKVLNDLDMEIDGFLVAHEMVLKNEPLEAIQRLTDTLKYFSMHVKVPFIRINDTEETYKQALNLITYHRRSNF